MPRHYRRRTEDEYRRTTTGGQKLPYLPFLVQRAGRDGINLKNFLPSGQIPDRLHPNLSIHYPHVRVLHP